MATHVTNKRALALPRLLVMCTLGLGACGMGASTGQPTATATPSSTGPGILTNGRVVPGTYRISNSETTLYPYTLVVPDGWSSEGNGVNRGEPIDGTGVLLTTWIITHVYADSCKWTGTLKPVEDRTALVEAFVQQRGHGHSAPVETTIGGVPATKISLTLDADADIKGCDEAFVRLWPDPGPDEGGGWPIFPGHTTTVYVMERDGRVMVLMTVQNEDSPPADVADLEAIVDSVTFEQ